MDHKAQLLGAEELGEAVSCFAEAMASKWPGVTKEEATQWVTGEFSHPKSLVFGVVKQRQILAVCCLAPLTLVLDELPENERTLLEKGLVTLASLETAWHFGGMGARPEWRGGGLGNLFLEEVLTSSKTCGRLVVAQTARPDEKFPSHILGWLKRHGARELVLSEKFYYAPDLEKVWVWWNF